MPSGNPDERLGEFEIISKIFQPLTRGFKGAYNLKDDCASIALESHREFVISSDTLVAGVHFFPDDPPLSVGHKALAVNISDISSKGAKPYAYTLSIAIPQWVDECWLQSFADGLSESQSLYDIILIGGDTVSTPGPLTISITIFGKIDKNKMVKRFGAADEDFICVTGTIGDSYLGLQLLLPGNKNRFEYLEDEDKEYLIKRYRYPEPRVTIAPWLIKYASSAMDISDGLVADANKLHTSTPISGTINISDIPLSRAAQKIIENEPDTIADLICGGDDYEILFTLPVRSRDLFFHDVKAAGLDVTSIGRVNSRMNEMSFVKSDGEKLILKATGYDHFS